MCVEEERIPLVVSRRKTVNNSLDLRVTLHTRGNEHWQNLFLRFLTPVLLLLLLPLTEISLIQRRKKSV